LKKVGDRSCAACGPQSIGWADVDAALAEMYPSQTGYDHKKGLSDFLASYLFLHDFERDVDGTGVFDRFPDLLGAQTAEANMNLLWGSWTVGGNAVSPDLDTAIAAATVSLNSYPNTASDLLFFETGRVFALALPGIPVGDPNPRISIGAYNNSNYVSDLSVRMYRKEAGKRAVELVSMDSVAASSTSSTALRIPADLASNETFYVAVATPTYLGGTMDVSLVAGKRERLAVLGRDSTLGGLAGFLVSGSALSVLAGGLVLPMDSGARSVVADPWQDRLYVSSQNGWVSVFDAREGAEAEIDTDPSDATMTRISAGTEPRGIATMRSLPYLLVATEDGIDVFDRSSYKKVNQISNAVLGIDGHYVRAYDIAVSLDDSAFFVTTWGQFGGEGEKVVVLDGSKMTTGVSLGSIRLGTSCNPQYLVLSPDGTMLAATCSDSSLVAILDARLYGVIDQMAGPTYFEPSSGLYAVAWAEDSSAVFAGYTYGHGSLDSYGVVRKCVIGEDDCWHEVGVQGSVRSLAVTGSGASRMVWTSDSLGYVTGLTDALGVSLFEAGQLTSGRNMYGQNDGTGGCLANLHGWDEEAVPCTDLFSTPYIGQAGSGMIRY
jgi:hypothetical protein